MRFRGHQRYPVWFPVRLDSESFTEEVGVTHDASVGGLLLSTSRNLGVGELVAVTFRVPPDASVERTVAAEIVRCEPNKDDPDGLWPFRIAVAFQEPIGELEAHIREMLDAPPDSKTPDEK